MGESRRLKIYEQIQSRIDDINRTIQDLDKGLPQFEDKSMVELSNSQIASFNEEIRKIEAENNREMEHRKKEINELMENIKNDLLATCRTNIGVDSQLPTSQSVYHLVKNSEKNKNYW